MSPPVRNVVVLGATGSIGRNTLEVISAVSDRLTALAISAHSRLDDLVALAVEHRPRWVIATDRQAAERHDWSGLPEGTELLTGEEGVRTAVQSDDADIVLAAIVGSAGLAGSWAALEAGKTLALANKETLVVGGPLVTKLARQTGARLLPVDSEHNAVFQALEGHPPESVQRIILTASGGPFRRHTMEQLRAVTVEEALAHPTWDMGPKITVDSATMMNKALEVIEARWLFDTPAEKIDIVVHPQSIVHSLVEFIDGSMLAQMSSPDMKLPIQHALLHPQRAACPAEKLDLTQPLQLDFEPPDPNRFPALNLGYEVAKAGGTAGAVLNAANEAAVARFLAHELQFLQIAAACRAVLDQHNFDPSPSLERLFELDAWARQEIAKWTDC